ncbi:MAG: hypothetical protein ACXWI6_15695, partial [Burkholderiales bacterium]
VSATRIDCPAASGKNPIALLHGKFCGGKGGTASMRTGRKIQAHVPAYSMEIVQHSSNPRMDQDYRALAQWARLRINQTPLTRSYEIEPY